MKLIPLLGRSLAATGLSIIVVSCGARSGLFGPASDDPGTFIEGGTPGADVVVPPIDAPTDAPPDAVPCVPGRFDFELAVPQMMLVIDRSGSMANNIDNDQPAPDGSPSRWTTLRDALAAALVPMDGQLEIGAKFYPESLDDDPVAFADGCLIDKGQFHISPDRNNASKVLNVFATRKPQGGTPTAEALTEGASVLGQTRGVARTIVLATDGAPNCNGSLNPRACVCTAPNGCQPNQDRAAENCLDDQRTVSRAAQIFNQQKIPVYVVGIGAEVNGAFKSTLDAIAVAGGRPRPGTTRYYSARSAAELSSAITSIRDSVASCTYLTPSAPTDPNAITVTVGGQTIARDQTHTNGWDWIDQTFGQLQFFGAACDALASDAGTVTVSGVVMCK